jgi:predicted nucleotidyltransferase
MCERHHKLKGRAKIFQRATRSSTRQVPERLLGFTSESTALGTHQRVANISDNFFVVMADNDTHKRQANLPVRRIYQLSINYLSTIYQIGCKVMIAYFAHMIITQQHLDTIIRIAHEYKARRLILFGSALEQPHNANDIDLAADIDGLNVFSFAEALELELQCPIDIVPLGDGMEEHPFIRSIVKYGKRLL